ncbi:MAG: tetratricopeptide repeat protein [Tepidisphaeraceae bacterium]|jgi:tetratricopeptide (TPR) repeat protein
MSDPIENPGPVPPASEHNASPDASPDQEIQPFVLSFPDDPISARDWALWAGVLALITLVCFWPSIPGSFIWDDDSYVVQNGALLNRSGLVHIWNATDLHTVQYYPLTFTTLWIEHHIWQNGPLGYRVVNLLLHAAGAIVLWRVLRRLALPGAWAIAALWAIHPLQVETVSWISERKNVLSGLLAISSLYFYLDFAGLRDPDTDQPAWQLQDRWQTYAMSLLCFVAAMLSKTAICGLPAALVMILWWKRRLSAATLAGLIPMFIVGAIGALVTSHFETSPEGLVRATGPEWDFSLPQRLLIAGRDFWFYIGKLFAPVHLSFNYPRIVPAAGNSGDWVFIAAAVIVIDLLFMFRRALGRGPVTAVICYVAMIFPALGFFNAYPFRYSFVADHLQYLAGIPLIALAVVAVAKVLGNSVKPLAVIACAALLVFGGASWARAKVFVDPVTLWEDTLDKNPNSWLAGYNLARDRMNAANRDLTLAGQLAAQNEPDASQGTADQASSELDDAVDLLHNVLANPGTPPNISYLSHSQLAAIDVTRTRWPDADVSALMQHAEDQLRMAIAGERQLDEAYPDPLPYYNMGLVQLKIAELGQKSLPKSKAPATTRPATPEELQIIDRLEAARDFLQQAMDAAKLSRDRITTHVSAEQMLGLSSFQRGNADFILGGLAEQRGDDASSDQFARDAMYDYKISLGIDPTNVEAQYRTGLCYERFGDYTNAKVYLLNAALYSPQGRYAPSYNEIGWIICRSNPTNLFQLRLAIQCFQDALNIDPNYTDARDNLQKAMQMLAGAKVTTESSTEPSTHP